MRVPHTWFSTEFDHSRWILRSRLGDLFASPRRWGAPPLVCAVLVTALAGGLASCGESPTSPSPAAEVLPAPRGRCRPRRQVVVPIFHGDSNQQKRLRGLPTQGFRFPLHPCEVVFVRHLQQQVFGTDRAVDAAASVLYLQYPVIHKNDASFSSLSFAL